MWVINKLSFYCCLFLLLLKFFVLGICDQPQLSSWSVGHAPWLTMLRMCLSASEWIGCKDVASMHQDMVAKTKQNKTKKPGSWFSDLSDEKFSLEEQCWWCLSNSATSASLNTAKPYLKANGDNVVNHRQKDRALEYSWPNKGLTRKNMCWQHFLGHASRITLKHFHRVQASISRRCSCIPSTIGSSSPMTPAQQPI